LFVILELHHSSRGAFLKDVFLVLALFFLFAVPVWSQTSMATPAATAAVTFTLQPIDTRFTTLEGLTYEQSGYELRSYEDLQTALNPLKDYETHRLLARSIETDGLGRLFKVVGLLGVAGGLVGLGTTNNLNDQTAFLLTALGGEVTFDIGLLFATESQTTKFNAVQRYNRFAYGREQMLPQTPVDEKLLLAPVPAVTPAVSATPMVPANAAH
jgi:hypothetical protein